ncbi:oxidoreductase [Neobacillus sp. PS3-40]|uniref:oxidoreductase n=1 Tax=Neobacillus sp. PS3-40 TaxID=3070679 RepID=UPI0027DED9E7|nr:oxidoreductase [Neobacillus sp. PS3-40]WML44128.1 oxidoreductase [Neobacillus sp. PS3-40]
MDKGNKTALLIGASGLVGNELLKLILKSSSYEKVKIFVRKRISIEHPNLEQIVINFDHLEEQEPHFKVNDVYCCLGTTIKKAGSQAAFKKVDFEYPVNLAKIAKKNGVQKFLIISALGADANSNIFYNRVKGELEEEVKKINLPSLHIFQPSLLLGKRQEFRFGEKIAILLSPIFSQFLRGGLQKYKPIKANDVACAMYVTAQSEQIGTKAYHSNQIFDLSKIEL